MEGLIGMVVLALLAVPVLLIVALVKIGGLRQRVDALEQRLAELPVGVAARPAAEPAAAGPAPAEPVRRATPATPSGPDQPSAAAAPVSRPVVQAAPVVTVPAAPPPRPRATGPTPLELGMRALRRWFSEGNVPVKVGMLVLFAGVAALLKHASDQGWVSFPIELRLAGIAAAAGGALAFGWRQRSARRGFALALQGGAIGVLLLVVFAAFKLYPLLPAGAAFGLSVLLVAGTGVLAVRQNALALAVLGLLAGFLAPLWLSTGQGSHVALFGYYAVLNAGIFAIAWWRAWRVLNVLGFAFTFGIGAVWGVLRYQPDQFATTEPFLLLFFGLYLLLPILYARRRAAGRRDLLDGCLVFGTPLVAFSLQAGLLQGESLPLAYCALALGGIYAALAWWLRRHRHFQRLVAPYAVLAVGFATLAVPLALSAQVTAAVFALEGAGLAWLGLRQHNRRQQLAGAALQVAAAVAFAVAVDAMAPADVAVANGRFMAALLVAVGGFAGAWAYRHARASSGIATAYYVWALAWWLGNAASEIGRFVDPVSTADWHLVLVVLTGALAAEAHRRLPSAALGWTAALALLAGLPLALAQDAAHGHPLAGHGAVAWGLFALAGWRVLGGLRGQDDAAPAVGHSAWWLGLALVAALSLQHAATTLSPGHGWEMAAFALPWLVLAALLQRHPHRIAPPLAEQFERWRLPLHGLALLVPAGVAVVGMAEPGTSAPLPWLPLLHPLALMQVAALVLVAAWWQPAVAGGAARWRLPGLAVAAFALVSVETLRACYHWGDAPWSGAMFSTSLAQTSLTVVWSLLGVLGWIIGSRRGQRALWLAGAVLMAVVLAKLLLVDRQHLGNLLGIASFIAYGLLCTVVGYIAPAPPRAQADLPLQGEAA
jgi:uncharacterized membrane protein